MVNTETNEIETSSAAEGGGRYRPKKRIWEIDVLRAFAFFYMVFDHLMFNLAFVFDDIWQTANKNHFMRGVCDFAMSYRNSVFVDDYLRLLLCAGLFMVLSGISSSFSKNNLKRGVIIFGLAIGLTLFTYVLSIIMNSPFLIIRFGILHMLGISIIAAHFLRKANVFVIIALAAVCIFLGFYFAGMKMTENQFLAMINMRWAKGFNSADYYPLLPNCGYFFAGLAIGKTLYKNRKSLLPSADFAVWRPFKWISRHCLILYFAHQVGLFVLLYLFGIIFIS